MWRPPFTLVGSVGVAGGCAGMAAMLPATTAGALGAIGISGSSALARTLAPIAEPLFIVSAVLVVAGALACSRLVVLLATAGSALLYLSMFALASGGATGSHSGDSMSAMSTTGPGQSAMALHAEPTSFYLGLGLLLAAFALTAARRRRHTCRPLLRLPRLVVR